MWSNLGKKSECLSNEELVLWQLFGTPSGYLSVKCYFLDMVFQQINNPSNILSSGSLSSTLFNLEEYDCRLILGIIGLQVIETI